MEDDYEWMLWDDWDDADEDDDYLFPEEKQDGWDDVPF